MVDYTLIACIESALREGSNLYAAQEDSWRKCAEHIAKALPPRSEIPVNAELLKFATQIYWRCMSVRGQFAADCPQWLLTMAQVVDEHYPLDELKKVIDAAEAPKREIVSPRSLPNDCCRMCEKKRIDAEIAAGVGFPIRLMVLCPICGNKRCPKATNHENACTGSNEPNQPGSAYQAENHIEDGSANG